MGLTAACELRRRGADVRIVDCAEVATDKSKALGVQARTLEALDSMGLVDRFLAAGRRIHRTNGVRRRQAHRARRDPRYRLALPRSPLDSRRRTSSACSRAQLVELGVAVERGLTLAALAQDDAGVTATLSRAPASIVPWVSSAGVGARRVGHRMRRRAQRGAARPQVALRRRPLRGVASSSADVRIGLARCPGDEVSRVPLARAAWPRRFPLPAAARRRVVAETPRVAGARRWASRTWRACSAPAAGRRSRSRRDAAWIGPFRIPAASCPAPAWAASPSPATPRTSTRPRAGRG